MYTTWATWGVWSLLTTNIDVTEIVFIRKQLRCWYVAKLTADLFSGDQDEHQVRALPSLHAEGGERHQILQATNQTGRAVELDWTAYGVKLPFYTPTGVDRSGD